jgi:hypothetical protein
MAYPERGASDVHNLKWLDEAIGAENTPHRSDGGSATPAPDAPQNLSGKIGRMLLEYPPLAPLHALVPAVEAVDTACNSRR